MNSNTIGSSSNRKHKDSEYESDFRHIRVKKTTYNYLLSMGIWTDSVDDIIQLVCKNSEQFMRARQAKVFSSNLLDPTVSPSEVLA